MVGSGAGGGTRPSPPGWKDQKPLPPVTVGCRSSPGSSSSQKNLERDRAIGRDDVRLRAAAGRDRRDGAQLVGREARQPPGRVVRERREVISVRSAHGHVTDSTDMLGSTSDSTTRYCSGW